MFDMEPFSYVSRALPPGAFGPRCAPSAPAWISPSSPRLLRCCHPHAARGRPSRAQLRRSGSRCRRRHARDCRLRSMAWAPAGSDGPTTRGRAVRRGQRDLLVDRPVRRVLAADGPFDHCRVVRRTDLLGDSSGLARSRRRERPSDGVVPGRDRGRDGLHGRSARRRVVVDPRIDRVGVVRHPAHRCGGGCAPVGGEPTAEGCGRRERSGPEAGRPIRLVPVAFRDGVRGSRRFDGCPRR